MPSPLIRLTPGVIDVVSWPLGVGQDEVDSARAELSPSERERADRIIAPPARERFVIARGRLREILGRVCGCAPREVRFETGPGGKPRLADDERLHFNMAHSSDLMLCAIALDREVGIDVEQVRDDLDFGGIAQQFFAPAEVRALRGLSAAVAREAFFACWTRKEAVVKATGEGLARALDSFAVSVDPAHSVMLSADPPLGPPEQWSLIPVSLPPGYQGTVAVRAHAILRQWSWPVPWMAAARAGAHHEPEPLR